MDIAQIGFLLMCPNKFWSLMMLSDFVPINDIRPGPYGYYKKGSIFMWLDWVCMNVVRLEHMDVVRLDPYWFCQTSFKSNMEKYDYFFLIFFLIKTWFVAKHNFTQQARKLQYELLKTKFYFFKKYLFVFPKWNKCPPKSLKLPEHTVFDSNSVKFLQMFYPSNKKCIQTLFKHSYIFPSLGPMYVIRLD